MRQGGARPLAFSLVSKFVFCRREQGFCKIGYLPSNEGNSFYLSFHPGSGGGTFKARAGEAGCQADFISIPRGSNSLGPGASSCVNSASTTVANIDKFCGQRLNCVSGSVSSSWIYS